MAFTIRWTESAAATFSEFEKAASAAKANRAAKRKAKSSKQEGLFKQVQKTIRLLGENPKHPSLHTHQYDGLENPFHKTEKVFEAYAQNETSSAYRVFWCYGREQGELTIIAITPHP